MNCELNASWNGPSIFHILQVHVPTFFTVTSLSQVNWNSLKMSLKHPSLYLSGTLTAHDGSIHNNRCVTTYISGTLASVDGQGDLSPGGMVRVKSVSASVRYCILLSQLSRPQPWWATVISASYFLAIVRKWKVMAVGRRLITTRKGGDLKARYTVNQILIRSRQW